MKCSSVKLSVVQSSAVQLFYSAVVQCVFMRRAALYFVHKVLWENIKVAWMTAGGSGGARRTAGEGEE